MQLAPQAVVHVKAACDNWRLPTPYLKPALSEDKPGSLSQLCAGGGRRQLCAGIAALASPRGGKAEGPPALGALPAGSC